MSGLWNDLRFAVRMLAKSPGFTAVVVVALGLGLGVNIAMFGAVNVYLMRPMPVASPERMTSVFMGPRTKPKVWGPFSYADYAAIRNESQIFSGVVAATVDSYALTSSDSRLVRTEERSEFGFGEIVSGNFFDVLGVHPILGRTFGAAEGDAPESPILVISHALWQRRFNADPAVTRRKLCLNATCFAILGVLPPNFKGVNVQNGIDYWYPVGARSFIYTDDKDWLTDHGRRSLRVFARLKPEITIEQAEGRLNVVAQELARQFPATNEGTKMAVTSEIEGRYGSSFDSVKLGSALALLITGLVLLISCANAANLLLARATARTKELGIRLALGAGRNRIIRQLMTESTLLALVGGALGLLFAFWFADLLHAFVPPMPFQFNFEFEPDGRTMAWSLGATLLAGFALGAFPAWRASHADLVTALKTDVGTEGQTIRRAGLRQGLVITQLAVSVVVVVSGGLVVRSLRNVEAVDPGYRTENLVSALVNPGLFTDDEPEMRQFFRELTGRLERLPGVRSVSSSCCMPLVNVQCFCGPLIKDGDAPAPPNQAMPVACSIVDTKYFETVGTELLFGRTFTEHEREGAPTVAVINGELARRMFGREQDALGKRFRLRTLEAPLIEIIGVARDGKYRGLLEETSPWLYLPGSVADIHDLDTMRTVLLRAESSQEVASVAEGLRLEVQKLDARIPVIDVLLADEHLSRSLYRPRLAAELGTILGLLALGLATMGIYSVMTYAVILRTKEMGIRMALGAQVADVVRVVMRQGLRLVVWGLVIGSMGALAVTHLLTSLLFGVSAADPATFLVTDVILAAVALLATFIPARRATKVDPMVALRYE
jgi:predicted permease